MWRGRSFPLPLTISLPAGETAPREPIRKSENPSCSISEVIFRMMPGSAFSFPGIFFSFKKRGFSGPPFYQEALLLPAPSRSRSTNFVSAFTDRSPTHPHLRKLREGGGEGHKVFIPSSLFEIVSRKRLGGVFPGMIQEG